MENTHTHTSDSEHVLHACRCSVNVNEQQNSLFLLDFSLDNSFCVDTRSPFFTA